MGFKGTGNSDAKVTPGDGVPIEDKNSRNCACERCFRDARLRAFVRERGTAGPCSWCGSRKAHRIALAELAEPFRDVVSIYQPRDDSPSWTC